MSKPSKPSLTYRDAGVDIDAGDALVENIKTIAEATRRPEVLTGLGGFGALFALPLDRYKEPVLVSGTDGVGTKLKLAIELGIHDTIGIDLVAMCANDIIVQGAEPLFFLDYMATGHLEGETAQAVIKGIGEGCKQAGAALIGGETAEMPGMYAAKDYDLAGFCVGIVERNKIITGEHVQPGDVLIGIASSGPHSNGYSLVRKVIEISGESLDKPFNTHQTLGQALLTPTRIYVKPLLELIRQMPVKALAHITGGGLPGNVPRVLPENTRAIINRGSWNWPATFQWLQEQGNVDTAEMYRTFNCGVGMVAVVSPDNVDAALTCLSQQGESPWVLGHIETATGSPEVEFCE